MKRFLFIMAMLTGISITACTNAGTGSETNPVDSMNRSGPTDTAAGSGSANGRDTAPMGDSTVHTQMQDSSNSRK